MSALAAIAIGQSLLKHDARNKQNAEYNWWKHQKDKETVRALRIKESGARQNMADITRSKTRDADIKTDAWLENRLDSLRIAESAKAAGLPEGQSTDALVERSIGEVLKNENAFLKDMDIKQQQYALQEREIQFGMDMAFLDAESSINSTRYRQGDGGMGLFMDLAGTYAKYGG